MTFSYVSRSQAQRNAKLEWLSADLGVSVEEARSLYTEAFEQAYATLFRQCKVILKEQDRDADELDVQRYGRWFESLMESIGRDLLASAHISDTHAQFLTRMFDPIFDIAGQRGEEERQLLEQCFARQLRNPGQNSEAKSRPGH